MLIFESSLASKLSAQLRHGYQEHILRACRDPTDIGRKPAMRQLNDNEAMDNGARHEIDILGTKSNTCCHAKIAVVAHFFQTQRSKHATHDPETVYN
jgi:hypothetical protein